ncbi:MAG TPA: hypothetical protein PKI20_19950 [Verrucomicrobiota bacterium]|nr:hypothetical protein [Verrucomicrobiota bacterium]HQL80052.1 hypothetical protein [Verrucomicrobiota bacterium]
MKRQAAQRLLSTIAPSGQVVVNGRPANAWLISALPAHSQDLLASRAQGLGYRNAEQLLSAPARQWEPPFPLAEVAQHCLDGAVKLQRALLRRLELEDDLRVSAAELEQIALEDYRREFGHAISGRHLRDVVKRTLERDGGAGQFSRLELFLAERPARKDAARPAIPLAVQTEFRELRDVIGTFKNPAQPGAAERAYLWLRAFELFEEKIAAGKPRKKVKSGLVRFLARNAPFMAASAEALRVAFNRKYNHWIESGRAAVALQDGRSEKSGFHRAPELKAEDRDALIAHAVLNCDGRVSQAWRELAGKNALSEELLAYHLSNPASKSYCPTRIREAVKYDVGMMDDIHHGPRQDKLNGAHISRDWSGVAAMDWLCGDDATLEVYFYVPDGKGWFTLMRGQFLPMIDVRSLRVLGFGLRPEKSYNAAMIRTLITRVCDEHGLPRKGFYFERGIWANSRLLKGDASADPLSWPETELGLRSLGLRFVHSKLPRSKPIERVIGALQDLMEGEPGYVGPDEMHEKFERVQKAKLQVQARKTHPSEHFYSLDEWEARLEEISAQYNATPQGGKMTGGHSPDDAFFKFRRADDPPTKLPASCRYLLAHHKRPLKVTSNGITLRFGKQAYNYRNEETGRLRGQMVLAWWNPELPETLTVTDMNRENAFCVALSPSLPAMDATTEQLEDEFGRIAAHQSYARVRYRMLRTKYATPFRRAVVDGATADLGRQIEAQQAQTRAEQGQEARRQTKLSSLSRNLNMTLSPAAARRPETLPAVERLSQLLKEEENT